MFGDVNTVYKLSVRMVESLKKLLAVNVVLSKASFQ